MNISLTNSFGNVYLVISTDDTNGWIYSEWIGMLTVDNVIEGTMRVLEVMKETGLTIILNDNRRVTGSWNNANDWLEKEWAPRATKAGLRRCAHLVPKSILAAASAAEMKRRVGYELQLFSDIEKAKQWLKETDK